jgi:hypothetical protein
MFLSFLIESIFGSCESFIKLMDVCFVMKRSRVRNGLSAGCINSIDKRGQFFLLAAVIISAVIISLGVGTNRVTVNEDPGSFYDFSYEVKREVGAVMDYEVYSGFSASVDLTEFVDLLATEIEERSPGSDFIFIYGDSSDMAVKNYGSESVYADGMEIVGANEDAVSRVCFEEICQNIGGDLVDFKDVNPFQSPPDISRDGSDNILVEIEGNEFVFPLSDHRQVIFIMQKSVGGDRHVVVE